MGAMRQVPAVSQGHAEQGVARFQQRGVHRRIRLGPGMWLHIGVIRLVQLASTVDCQLLDHVHMLASPVVALGGITLRILVGQHRPLGFQDSRAGVVLGGDQFDMFFLTATLRLHRGSNLRVESGNGQIFFKHGNPCKGLDAAL